MAEKRTCPYCHGNNYSTDVMSEYWTCAYCGKKFKQSEALNMKQDHDMDLQDK